MCVEQDSEDMLMLEILVSQRGEKGFSCLFCHVCVGVRCVNLGDSKGSLSVLACEAGHVCFAFLGTSKV